MRRGITGGRREFGRLRLRGRYITVLICAGKRETHGRGCRWKWRERVRGHVMDWGWLAPASRWCGGSWQFGGKGRQGRCGGRGEKSLQANLLLLGVRAGEADGRVPRTTCPSLTLFHGSCSRWFTCAALLWEGVTLASHVGRSAKLYAGRRSVQILRIRLAFTNEGHQSGRGEC